MKELEAKRRQERDRKHRKEREEKLKEASASRSTPATNHSASQTPVHSSNPWRSNQHPNVPTQPRASQQPRIPQQPRSNLSSHPSQPANARQPQNKHRGPPPALVKARLSILQPSSSTHTLPARPAHPASGSSSSTPMTRGRRPWRIDDDRETQESPMPASRSPSPIARRPGQSGKSGKQREHEAVLEELSKSGFDHVTIDGQLGGAVREDDVRQFFDGFEVDKVSTLSCFWLIAC